jgi:hypothetical protein
VDGIVVGGWHSYWWMALVIGGRHSYWWMAVVSGGWWYLLLDCIFIDG